MRRTTLFAPALACILSILAAAAPAVEVTVKANTTLYGPDGKAVMDVPAGQRFDATRMRGDWVWGSIKTEHGTAEGWIKLIALAMSDETRQALAAQSTPTTTQAGGEGGSISVTAQGAGQEAGEPVVLRYKLGLNELQLYEGLQEIKTEFNVPSLEGSVEESILVQAVLTGKGIDADGTLRGELAFHGFQYKKTSTINGATTRLEGDRDGATLFQGDKQIATAKWGSSKLGDVPDFAKRLNAKCAVTLTDRGKVEFAASARRLGAFDLEEMLGGPCVYPEEAVTTGDSWTVEIDESFGVEGLEGASIPLTGQIKYTVLGRIAHRQRPCLKLGIEGTFKEGEAPAGLQLTANLKGTTIVDIATGIKLDTDVLLTLSMAGSITGSQMQVNGTARLRAAYRGNKLN